MAGRTAHPPSPKVSRKFYSWTYKHAASGSGDHPQAGLSFTVNGVTRQTDANGQACFDGLLQGPYTVRETVPAGYHVDGNDKSVTVDNAANCSDATCVAMSARR